MQYVHVETAGKPIHGKADYVKASVGQVEIALFSLIKGLKQKRFGLDTLIGVADDIEHFRTTYLAPYGKQLLIDSGGYSVIVGNVFEKDISKFIGCYHEYQEKIRQKYDYIMTLNIPLIIGDDSFNTIENVYRYNHQSLAATKENLIKYPELRDKVYLVEQFKTREHFEIWTKIVQDLDLNRYVKHRALGGMVGLRRLTDIDFSPFIANAFKSFFDYENSPDPADEFRLHFLGINIKYDRFTIALLEKLFEKYMGGHRKAVLTYDSINYHRSAQLKMKSLEIYDFQDELIVYREIPSVPESILKKVYQGNLFEAIKGEIDKIKAFRRVNHSGAFGALNIYSNRSLDRYFEHVIDGCGLIDLIINHKNGIHFVNRVRFIFDDLSEQHPYLFTPNMIHSIKNNLSIILDFHNWYENRREYETLDRKIYGVLSEKTYLRVKGFLIPFLCIRLPFFFALSLATLGFGAVLSLSGSVGICGRIISYKYH